MKTTSSVRKLLDELPDVLVQMFDPSVEPAGDIVTLGEQLRGVFDDFENLIRDVSP